MRMFAVALLGAALPLTAKAAALETAPLSTATVNDGHGALTDVLVGTGRTSPALEASLRTLAARMQTSDPILAEAEQTFPGICQRLAASMRPVFVRHQERIARGYRPRLIALLRGAMSAEEAADIAAFYRSPLGARISRSVATTQKASQVGQAHADKLSETLTRDEIAYVDRFFSKGAGRKLTPVLPQLTALRAEMERAPLSADDRAEIKAIVTRAVSLFRVLPDAPSVLPPAPPLKVGRGALT